MYLTISVDDILVPEVIIHSLCLGASRKLSFMSYSCWNWIPKLLFLAVLGFAFRSWLLTSFRHFPIRLSRLCLACAPMKLIWFSNTEFLYCIYRSWIIYPISIYLARVDLIDEYLFFVYIIGTSWSLHYAVWIRLPSLIYLHGTETTVPQNWIIPSISLSTIILTVYLLITI